MPGVDRMDPDALAELVAVRVVELLRDVPARRRIVGAGELAEALGVTPAWVRQHADELGVMRLGDGPRPRLRFDLDDAISRFTCSPSRRSSAPNADGDRAAAGAPRRSVRRLPNGLPEPGAVLRSRPTVRRPRA